MFRKVPIIVILGSTGTGKTKLSIELAQRFGGEIISADSMQVYKGLDVATAKATKEEQATAPHHLLDIAHPDKPFTVVDFRNAALPIVDSLLNKSKIPIIVGGTNYYIESLLWKVLVNTTEQIDCASSKRRLSESEDDDKTRPTKKQIVELDVNNIPDISQMEHIESVKLHELLKTVDPKCAERLHPNNKRKIIRAFEVFQSSGKQLSAIIDEQRNTPGGSYLGGPLRYEHVIIFSVRCEQEILNKRLDDRVDGMLSQGLLSEIRGFYDALDSNINNTKDYTKGILQTIGFKEFIPYLEKFDAVHDKLINEYIHSLKEKQSNQTEPEGLPLLRSCLDELKLVTKRYSKKQLKWVNNRFLSYVDRNVPPLYQVDSSFPINWKEAVYNPAVDVVESYINDSEAKLKPLEKLPNPRAGLNEEVTNICNICERHFIGEYQWNIHLKSNKHKKQVAKSKKTIDNIQCKVVEKE